MKHLQSYRLFENRFEPIEWSGGDVTHMPIIGQVITKPVGPFESGTYDIVEILDSPSGRIYIANRWYKRGVPQLIHQELVSEFIPGDK